MSKGKKKTKQPPRPQTGVVDALIALVPILLLLGLRTVAGACTHDGAACTTANHVLTGLAIAGILLCCTRILSADKATKRSFDLMLAIVGVATAAMPGYMLQLCTDTTMQCHTRMLLLARVCGVLLIVGAVLCELTVDYEEPTRRKRRR